MEAKTDNKKLTLILVLGVVYLIGPVLFSTTDPNKLPLPLLILPFAWLFIVLVITSQLVLRKGTKANKKQRTIISSLIASLFVLLLVFQSIHQLSIRDVFIAIGIVGIAAVYMLRADFIK